MPARFYSADLAFVHDEGFTQFARDAANGLATTLRSMPGKHVVELGCGSGRMAKMLLRKGFSVSGVDISPAMIVIARKVAPRGIFVVGSLWDYTIPECGAVMFVGEVLNYTAGGKGRPGELRRLFANAYQALLPSGIFVFDILTERRSGSIHHTRTFTEGRDWMVAVEKTDTRRRVTRRITIFRKIHGSYRKTREVHTVRRLPLDVVIALMRDVGFHTKTRQGYLKKALGDGHVVVVGTKSGGRSITPHNKRR